MQHKKRDASFEAFMAVMFQVEVFWVVILCKTLVPYHNTMQHHNPEDLDLKEEG
jgi:hypothetical protein